ELILDAGSALNHSFILDHSSFQKKTVHLMTLAPEKNCFWQRGFSYLFDDLRSIPIRESFYDMIMCLSTLEHVGCDNESFTNDNLYKENNPNDFVLVMQEFRRVLKPGGILLLTVPYGTNKHFLTFQQFDMKMLQRAIDAFGKTKRVTGNFYKYSDKGWNISDEENSSECEYVEWVALPKHKRPNPLPVEPDLAAAARAVACVQIVKA
ncbi:methyltransferase domain-containing protein, partial [bacterium]|nr:methyltransferase domain-containing protein [bacterium]